MRALVGHTGFVGGTLRAQAQFDALYNSGNIGTIEERSFDLIVCAGAPAAKWKANRDPVADRANLDVLMGHLARARAKRFVLISTVDVYPVPRGVDEESPIDPDAGSAYGRHRLLLEGFALERFATTVLRLPALFGTGLKKNAVYDLLHDNCVDALQPASSFQFYDLRWLWSDIEKVLAAGIDVLNVATEPVVLGELARTLFGRDLPRISTPVSSYDVRSRHGSKWGRRDGYVYGRQQVLAAMRAFIEGERTRERA